MLDGWVLGETVHMAIRVNKGFTDIAFDLSNLGACAGVELVVSASARTAFVDREAAQVGHVPPAPPCGDGALDPGARLLRDG